MKFSQRNVAVTCEGERFGDSNADGKKFRLNRLFGTKELKNPPIFEEIHIISDNVFLSSQLDCV